MKASALYNFFKGRKMAYLQLFFVSLVSISFMFISTSHSSLDYGNVKSLLDTELDEKVNLSLYYETLCPYCAYFISNDLVRVFQNGLDTIVNLRLVPWGNAVLSSNRISCQYGEDECYLNTIHGCVIHLWPDVRKHFDFIHCTEQQLNTSRGRDQRKVKTREELWKSCSEKLRLSEDRIKKCYDSGYGHTLQLKYANETASLNPPHQYVPWVVVNNQPLLEDFENFVKYVCHAYKGVHVPDACKDKTSNISSAKKAKNNIHVGCYTSEFRNSAAKTSSGTKQKP